MTDKAAFWNYVQQGIPVGRAAMMCGFSESTGRKWVREAPELHQKVKEILGVNKSTHGPAPRSYDELSPEAQRGLSDFAYFSERYFIRYPSPWRKVAADEIVVMLTDRLRKPDQEDWLRFFLDINCPPGVGKTTLFTHDIPAWLICGGGSLDPAFGRALRIMLGSRVARVAKHFTGRLRRTMERRSPFFDKTTRQRALATLIDDYGRFKPETVEGDIDTIWRVEEWTVAQLEDIDLYEQEPTCMAVSQKGGFLGDRCDYYSWDDLTTKENTGNAEIAKDTDEWFEDQAESRLEPGGVGALVGQRLNNLDLHRFRLNKTMQSADGETVRKYHHIVFPAHFDHLCDGDHRQWDGQGAGCLLDARRLPWPVLLEKQSSDNYRTVYQQEDQDPEDVLVHKAWIDGGIDPDGFPAPGCLDHDRKFWQWPDGSLITYATVDPAAGNWWAIEVKAVDPRTRKRSLIYGSRLKMQAGQFLDFDPEQGHHVGLMEDLQNRSGSLGRPIMVWVVEQNAAHKYLFQTKAYQLWRRKWPNVKVIPHVTGQNKADQDRGVEATLPMLYKTGMMRMPSPSNLPPDHSRYVRQKIHELTHYPHSLTQDIVVTEWFGEYRMDEILRMSSNLLDRREVADPKMPAYLARQQVEIPIGA